MARDYEDIRDLDGLSDDELRGLVHDQLVAHSGVDDRDVTVVVDDGTVVLQGRVGTDAERRIAEHVVTDVIGIVSVRNELVVDPTRRAHTSLDPEAHRAEELETEGLLLGDTPPQQADTVAETQTTVDEGVFGTTDVQKTIATGEPWIPPTRPTPEGMRGTDADLGSLSEDH